LGRPNGSRPRKAPALLQSGDVDAKELAALVKAARDAAGGRTTRAVPQQQAEVRVWSVLTVDVVKGRIQTVRIVRNPDKLGHL
jgi:RNA polymerase sigma-70 factor (ECF subfamily)